MKPTNVHRIVFSKGEVFAALMTKAVACDYAEIRVDGDEVVLDFINPRKLAETVAKQIEQADPEQLQPEQPQEESKPEQPPGPNGLEAIDLCASRAFQTFLEVRDAKEAMAKLLKTTHAENINGLDDVKTWRTNFRDVVGEFELWMRG